MCVCVRVGKLVKSRGTSFNISGTKGAIIFFSSRHHLSPVKEEGKKNECMTKGGGRQGDEGRKKKRLKGTYYNFDMNIFKVIF